MVGGRGNSRQVGHATGNTQVQAHAMQQSSAAWGSAVPRRTGCSGCLPAATPEHLGLQVAIRLVVGILQPQPLRNGGNGHRLGRLRDLNVAGGGGHHLEGRHGGACGRWGQTSGGVRRRPIRCCGRRRWRPV